MRIDTLGTGPALVLVHGWAMHSGLFAPLIERLQSQFTLHLFDLPGHGHNADSSIALELEAVAAEVSARVPQALWLGWSLGGLVALHAAATRPASVRGLIMLGATPRFVFADDWAMGMDPAIFRGFAGDLQNDYRGTLDRFLMLEAQGSEQMREELRVLRERVFQRGEPSVGTLCQGLNLLETSDLRATLPRLQTPSLWLAGRRDRLVSPEAMRTASALAPNSRFVQIDGGGHSPFLTHTEAVAEAIIAFAESSLTPSPFMQGEVGRGLDYIASTHPTPTLPCTQGRES